MKKLFTLVITITLVIGSYTFFPTTQINAESEESIQTGDTLKLLCKKYGIDKNETELIDLRFFNEEEKVNSPMTLIEKKIILKQSRTKKRICLLVLSTQKQKVSHMLVK